MADNISAFNAFKTDIVSSVRLLAANRMLAAVTIILAVSYGPVIPPALSFLFLPVALFSIGWYGTQRVWFLRLVRDQEFSAREGWDFTWKFLGRFFVLGLCAAPVGAVAAIFLLFGLAWGRVALAAVVVPLDILLTFVTPALAYETNHVGEAFKIGREMLRDRWSECLWYALAPPLVLQVVFGFLLPTADLGYVVRFLSVVISSSLVLVFRCANACFYMRNREVGDDGSALVAD